MYTCYAPRRLEFLGVEAVRGFRLKVYAVAYGASALERAGFDDGMRLASAALPAPAAIDGRPGVGFVILHRGATGDYVVLCWWDRENELPTRVFVRDVAGWRRAREGESFCVWDLAVMWAEREAYVRHVLGGKGDGVGDYLHAHATGMM